MNYYTSVFSDSKIDKMIHNPDGTVMHATFTLKGQTFMCIDSTLKHAFTFRLLYRCLSRCHKVIA